MYVVRDFNQVLLWVSPCLAFSHISYCSYRECLGEAHEPSSCDRLQKWKGEIAEIKPESCKIFPRILLCDIFVSITCML